MLQQVEIIAQPTRVAEHRSRVCRCISRGQLRKVCGTVADSLATAYQELLALLPAQERLNVDETGHKENAQRLWT